MINFKYSHAKNWLDKNIFEYQNEIDKIHEMIYKKRGKGSDYLGWVDWVSQDFTSLFNQIDNIKNRLVKKHNIKYLVVIGIGGSYLGTKAVLSMFEEKITDSNVKILFSGYNLDSNELKRLLKLLEGQKFAINVVSKSGKTLEPALSFRFLKDLLMRQNPNDYNELIISTTDSSSGTLFELSNIYGFERLVIPNDIGGRFSIFTSVGLFPMAMAGLNIKDFIKGANDIKKDLLINDIEKNIAYQYALIRNQLFKKDYKIELLINYDQKLNYLSAWWKQLFGESEGKDGLGIYPSSLNFTTDLHSLGQFIQDGPKIIFETTLLVEEEQSLIIPYDEKDLDGLNYLSGKPLSFVNEQAFRGTLNAHVEGEIPNLLITIKKIDEYHIGALLYFFLISCAASGYLLGVNPFDQPGVESYKQQMYKLLGK